LAFDDFGGPVDVNAIAVPPHPIAELDHGGIGLERVLCVVPEYPPDEALIISGPASDVRSGWSLTFKSLRALNDKLN
jgi:hypothetical protein